jgi:hypothetical protein
MGYSNWSNTNDFTTKASYGISGIEQVKLIGDPTSYNFFGYSVSLNSIGDTVAIGVSGAFSNAGYVKIYKNISGTWTLQGNTIYAEALGDYNGASVSLNSAGDIVAIGAYNSNGSTGYVRVYKLISSTWTLQGAKILGENNNDYFGWSVSINDVGDILVVGAHYANSRKGYVKVYKNISGTWTLQGAKLVGEAINEYFGNAVSINGPGDIIIVGAPYANSFKGYVKVYKNISGTWTLQGAKLEGENTDDRFGSSVSIKGPGDIIIVGANNANNGTGYVKVYKLISGTWIQQGDKLTGENTNDKFGNAVSINSAGDTVAIGAVYGASFKGYVKIYKNISGTWTLQGTRIDGEATNEYFSNAISINSAGDILAVGAPYATVNSNLQSGYIKIYK